MKHILRKVIPSIWFYAVVIGFLLLFNHGMVNAQTISRIQNMNFGVFIPTGQGGTITVLPDHTYRKDGEIILLGIPTPASFDLNIEAGKTVQILYDKYVKLSGVHGGIITLELTDSSLDGSGSIITGKSPTRITLGGTMTIGPAVVTKVGTYAGSVQVNIIVIH
jgi:hypothetical protein